MFYNQLVVELYLQKLLHMCKLCFEMNSTSVNPKSDTEIKQPRHFRNWNSSTCSQTSVEDMLSIDRHIQHKTCSKVAFSTYLRVLHSKLMHYSILDKPPRCTPDVLDKLGTLSQQFRVSPPLTLQGRRSECQVAIPRRETPFPCGYKPGVSCITWRHLLVRFEHSCHSLVQPLKLDRCSACVASW